MQAHDARQHAKHGWQKRTTDHIRNVDYLDTHFLVECACGFYGWIQKETYDRANDTVQS